MKLSSKLIISLFDSVKILIKKIFCVLVRIFNGKNKRRNSLLVVQIAGIGDFILGSSILGYIRKLYPDRYISYLVKDCCAPLLESCPFIDEILEYPSETISRNIKVRWDFFSRLVQGGFDIVIYPYRSRTESVEEIVFWTGAREIISYEADEINRICNPSWRVNERKYTKLFPCPEENLHELDLHKAFLQWLTGEKIEQLSPVVWPARHGEEIIKKIKNEYGFDCCKQRYVVFFPGALSAIRMWPSEHYVEIGKKILKQYSNRHIVICGGDQEVSWERKIIRQLAQGSALGVCGKTDLAELAFLLKNADLYVGSETGAYHLAVALGIPTVCILGGGFWGRFAPYPGSLHADRNMPIYSKMDCFGCLWSCRYGRPICIEQITTDMVWEKVSKALALCESEKWCKKDRDIEVGRVC